VRPPDANRRGPQRQGPKNVRASTKTDADNMQIVRTVDDARMYTKPWSFTTYPKRLQGEILEYLCNQNEADARHLVGK